MNYALWEVIVNGDSHPPKRIVDGVEQTYPPTTAKKKLARKNELKARGTLLIALPNEHQLKFNSYKNAKSLMEAIEKRFGGNKESKKTLKTLLKQQYENFNGSSLKGLDPTYNRLQKLISQLEIIARGSNSTNTDGLSDAMAMLTMRAKRFLKKTGRKVGANGFETIGFDKTKVKCCNCHKKGHFLRDSRALRENRKRETVRINVTVETTYVEVLVAQDGIGYDWSDQAEDEPTNFALMAYIYLEARLVVYKKKEDIFEENIKILKFDIHLRDNALIELRNKLEKDEKERDEIKITLEKFENSSKTLNKMLNSQVNDKYKTSVGYHAVPLPYTGNFLTSKPDLILAEVDEYVVSESVTSVPAVATNKAKTNESKPNYVSETLIEDWITDSEDENKTKSKSKQRKPSFAKVEFVKPNEQVKSLTKSVKHEEHNSQAKHPRRNSQSPRGNKSYLTYYKEIDKGFVAFGGNSKGGKVTGKGKIRAGIENLKDLRVKVIRTPQQNEVAERKNRTLIEAARTMLADSKLPTTFLDEAVNTVCYVQNRVLIIKPHNKTPYELFLGNQSNGSVGKAKVETLHDKDYILLPLWTQDPLFSSSSKDSLGAGCKPSGEEEKKDVEDPGNKDSKVVSIEEPRVNQEKDANVNSTNNINTVSLTINATDIEDNDVEENIVYKCFDDLKLPNRKRPIGTKWVFKNKKDDKGIVIKNKARLVAQGYTQEDRIDYDEVFAAVAKIEAIRLFLAYALFKDFMVYQMDVKSAFLYGKIEEEVHVFQSPGFEDPDFPDKVYKVGKALYVLHQDSRAWSETFSTYLLDNRFQRGMIDKTLFIKKDKNEFYGRDHILLGLQVKQKEDGIFIRQDKYVNAILNKFGFSNVKTASTPMETHKNLYKDEKGKDVDEHLYRSMIGSLMYLTSSRPDIMFVVCACARFQVHPKNSHLHVVKRIFRYLKVMSPVFHSKTKHIEIRHHFFKYSNEKKLIQMIKIHTYKNVADLLTKAFAPNESEGFEQIIDFLNAHPVKYTLTVSPTIYSSCIEQFWATAKVKHVNEEAQLYAKVDGKKVVISEASIKRDLRFGDEGGIAYLPNEAIFEQLTLTSAKTITWNEFSSTIASAVICLATKQKFNFSKYIFESMTSVPIEVVVGEVVYEEMYDSMERAATTATGIDVEHDMGIISKTQFTATLNEPSSIETSSGSEPRLQETVGDVATKTRVLDLEMTKTAQAKEIINLKKRVKRLERKKKSRSHGLKRLYKVRLSAIVESFAEEESMGEEESSKQGRIEDIDADDKITLVNDQEMFDADRELQGEEVVARKKKEVLLKEAQSVQNVVEEIVSTVAPVTTAVTADELTFSQALVEINKGKGIMVEEPLKMKKKDQISFDEQEARRLQAEIDEQDRLAEEKSQLIEDENLAWDNV
uniref:Putative ribonuclease H-like domain-containing protein n=1 Tax=Tanacetum cinerariifolium TaxID=118510 RepID=A0A6L2KVW5_TANCI|nr:putative ribonuclease H-like domain-containing protein [Tanacetum cinerariifolium]